MLKPSIVDADRNAGNWPPSTGRSEVALRVVGMDGESRETPLGLGRSESSESQTAPSPSPYPPADSSVVPPRIEATRLEIQRLFREAAHLAQTSVSVAEFCQEFLQRLLEALGCSAGQIWLQQGEEGWKRVGQLERAELETPLELVDLDQQRRLLELVLGQQSVVAVPSSLDSHLRLLGRFAVDDGQVGVIEVFQRPGTSDAAQRGYLQFLRQMTDLAGDFFRRERLRTYHRRETQQLELEQLSLLVHGKLDRQHVAYAVANEGRRLLGCDRVSVVLGAMHKFRVAAISGLDTFHSRSENVRALRDLSRSVLRVKRPLWYPHSDKNLPPQIDSVLQDYLDQSQARSLTVLPLFASPAARQDPPVSSGKDRRDLSEPVGALICEQLRRAEFDQEQREFAIRIAGHAGVALANAAEHQGLFLLPIWKSLGALVRPLTPPYLARTSLLLAMLCAVVLGLIFTPTDFQVHTRGKLLPSERRDVFSHVSGIISHVHVQHAQRVAEGQLLLTMRSTDIAVSLSELEGQRGRTVEQIFAKEQLLLRNSRLSPLAQDQVAGELDELKQALESIERRIELAREKESLLYVRSPMAGEVVTWQVADTLQQRPVNMGQVLMSIINPDGPWELELYVHERRLGHVLRAWDDATSPLTARFQLSTHPGQSFEGEVMEIQQLAELRGDQGNSVAIRVAIRRDELPQLHNETSVTARILCGRRPLGFVLFQDAIETAHGAFASFW